MKAKIQSLLLFSFLFTISSYAQIGITIDRLIEYRIEIPKFSKEQIDFPAFTKLKSDPKKEDTIYSKNSPFISSLPSAYNYDELAMFCKLEVKIEQVTKVPFKMRLGNMQYVDQLELRNENHGNYIPELQVSDHYNINTSISNKKQR